MALIFPSVYPTMHPRGLLLFLNYTVAKIPATSTSWIVTASQAPGQVVGIQKWDKVPTVLWGYQKVNIYFKQWDMWQNTHKILWEQRKSTSNGGEPFREPSGPALRAREDEEEEGISGWGNRIIQPQPWTQPEISLVKESATISSWKWFPDSERISKEHASNQGITVVIKTKPRAVNDKRAWQKKNKH